MGGHRAPVTSTVRSQGGAVSRGAPDRAQAASATVRPSPTTKMRPDKTAAVLADEERGRQPRSGCRPAPIPAAGSFPAPVGDAQKGPPNRIPGAAGPLGDSARPLLCPREPPSPHSGGRVGPHRRGILPRRPLDIHHPNRIRNGQGVLRTNPRWPRAAGVAAYKQAWPLDRAFRTLKVRGICGRCFTEPTPALAATSRSAPSRWWWGTPCSGCYGTRASRPGPRPRSRTGREWRRGGRLGVPDGGRRATADDRAADLVPRCSGIRVRTAFCLVHVELTPGADQEPRDNGRQPRGHQTPSR